MVNARRKLLVLDINGLLLDTYYQGEARPDRVHDAKVNRFYVYKRTFCDDFIQFCLKNFIVGVWSSAREHNVHSLVNFMFKEAKEDLAFIWRHTAIFPKTYKATDPEDNYLAEELVPYLEGLLKARDVQKFIQRNPVGEASISASDPQWSQILKSGQFNNEEKLPIPAHLLGIRVPERRDPILAPSEWTNQRHFLPVDGVSSPPHMSAETQSWNAAHGERRWRRLDRVPQPDWAYDGAAYDPQGFARGYFGSGAGPSWPAQQIPNDSSYGLIRRHAMLSGRPSDYGDICRGEDWRFNDLQSHNRYDDNRYDDRRGSFRKYDDRASDWSEEPEDFRRGESWDFHRGGARYQEGSYQGEGKRKRSVDWRNPKSGRR